MARDKMNILLVDDQPAKLLTFGLVKLAVACDEYVPLVMNMAPDGLNVTFAIAPCASWGIVGQVNAIGAAIILP